MIFREKNIEISILLLLLLFSRLERLVELKGDAFG